MKRATLVLIGLLVLTSCVQVDESGEVTTVFTSSTPMPSSTLFATLESAVKVEIVGTAVLTEQPVPSPSGNALAYPPPSVEPTPPYPGPSPGTFPTRIRPTPTPTISVQPVDDCTLHPSFNRCGGAPLVGKLAYFSTDRQLTVLNLDTETAWFSTQSNLRDVDWSSAGDRLLVHDESLGDTYFYHQDGRLLHNETSGWVMWGSTGNEIRGGSYLVNEDHSITVSLVFVEVPNTEGDNTHPERRLQVDFQDGTGRQVWSLEAPNYRYDIVSILDWIPQTEWILVGYANGGVAARIVSGNRLMAVNVRSGEIVDSRLFVPGIDQIDWHPMESGLLVTADLSSSEISGMGTLVTWQVWENQTAYLAEASPFIRSPVWSPDGRYLAYTAYDVDSENTFLMVLDTKTGIAAMRAKNGEFPAWSRDGSIIFYLELGTDKEPAYVWAVGREQGAPLLVAESRFPRCPGPCLPGTIFDYTP
ncbi:MAG: TolB family protein [Anaerolineae bacterium]